MCARRSRVGLVSLSVTKSAFATDRRFPATLLHACVFRSQSTHPFHPAYARCGDLSFCRFTDLRTASVPAFQPAQTFMTCLTQSGPCCFFFFFFFFLKCKPSAHYACAVSMLGGGGGGGGGARLGYAVTRSLPLVCI